MIFGILIVIAGIKLGSGWLVAAGIVSIIGGTARLISWADS